MDNINTQPPVEAAKPTSPPVQTVALPAKSAELPIKFTPVLKIALIVLGFLFLLILLLTILGLKKGTPLPVIQVSPLPTAVPSPSEQTRPVSQFGQTSGFQSFETQLKTVSSVQDNLDLSESKLSFPLLDTNVNFNK